MTYFVIISNFDVSICNNDTFGAYLWYNMWYIHRSKDSQYDHHTFEGKYLKYGMHQVICIYLINDKI